MTPKTTVRLIHHGSGRSCTLYLLLEEPLAKIIRAWSAREGDEQPCEIPPPPLLLADTFQADGGWADASGAEAEAAQPASSVATIAPVACSGLCIDTTDHGTFDLLAAPFTVLRSGLC